MQGETCIKDMEPEKSGWLTLAEAAAALGVSVDTVRRRLKRGQLVGERRPTLQGFAWMIRPDAERPSPSNGLPGSLTPGNGQPGSQTPSSQAPDAGQPGSAPGHDAATWATLVRELQAELVRRSEAAALWQGRALTLQERAGQLESQLARALEAPRETPTDGLQTRQEGRETASPGGTVPGSTPAPATPWWRRVWSAVTGA
jgi:hypothetical protein